MTKARQPFRRCIVLRHHPYTHKRGPTALQEHRRRPLLAAAFYSGHTPSVQHFKHVDDQSTHRIATAEADLFPAATHLPALAAAFIQRVTSLATMWRSAAVCPSLPGRHSFRVDSKGIRSISEDRSKKHPLTRRQRVFAVRHRLSLNLPASDYSPFMVELFAAAGFASGP